MPTDESLHSLGYTFPTLAAQAVAKIAANLEGDYDRIIIDCHRATTGTSDQSCGRPTSRWCH
jgi:hypothetical protein